jgi:hypothetical protein
MKWDRACSEFPTTGGTALPADFSPQSVPGTPDQPGDQGEPGGISGGASQPGGTEQPGGSGQTDGGSESGDSTRQGQFGTQPRPFFADQPDESGRPAQPGQPDWQGPLYGKPGSLVPPRLAGRAGVQDQGQPNLGQAGDQQNGWRPAGQPQQQRVARAQPKPPDRELKQRAIAALVLGALSLIALLGLGTDLRKGVYVLIFSAVVGIAGCVIGITAMVKARKTGSYRPRGAVGGIVLGTMAAIVSVPILATYLVFPTQVDNYVNCLHQAQISGNEQSCMNKFYKAIHLDTSASPATRPTSLTRHAPPDQSPTQPR